VHKRRYQLIMRCQFSLQCAVELQLRPLLQFLLLHVLFRAAAVMFIFNYKDCSCCL